MKEHKQKKEKGQFFTKGNPFVYSLFDKWFKIAQKESKNKIVLEPFAGSNNIVKMINLSYPKKNIIWECYDISPESMDKNITSIPIVERDVLKDFPLGFDIIITNPPYLAKNSATKKGLSILGKHDDLYKISLEVMLRNAKYVAAIVPESFIMQKLFHNRLYGVISLPEKMFEETECPVCLALFIPEEKKKKNNDFVIYSKDVKIGNYNKLMTYVKKPKYNYVEMKFNDPLGQIALINIDNTKNESILFLLGENVESEKIKETNRSFTKISGFESFTHSEIVKIIDKSNQILKERRLNTSDVFMTAFKGLRKDGKYRRRLDFIQARDIINIAIKKL